VIRRVLRRFGIAVARRPAAFLAASVFLGIAALAGARHLRFETDLAASLPRYSPAAAGYRAFAERFSAAERAFVVVRPAEGETLEPDDLADAAESLAVDLAAREEVSWARSGLEREDERFLLERLAPRLPFLLGARAAETIAARTSPESARETARRIRETLASPLGPVAAPFLAADPLGLAADSLAGASAGGSVPLDPATGAFLSDRLDAALVIFRPARSEVDPGAGEALDRALSASYAAVRERTGLPLRFDAIGGPLYAHHDAIAIRGDLLRIVGAAGAIVAVLIFLAFGGPTVPAVALAAVALGQLWTAGIVGSRLGTIGAVGAGFAAILLGLGDDFSIHLGARFREHRARGIGRGRSLVRTFVETGPGIVSAAIATAAAFACLAFAAFPPLRELGIVVAIGVVALLAATFLVAAPLFVWADRIRGPRREGRAWSGFGRALEAAVSVGNRRPRATIAAAIALTALGAAGIPFLHFDPDLRRLRPDDLPSERVERLLATSFGLGADTATVIVPAADLDGALDAATRVTDLVRREAGEDAEIASPSDWFVSGERRRRALAELSGGSIEGAAERLEAAFEAEGLRPEGFAPFLDGLRSIARGDAPAEIPWTEWPDWLRDAARVDAEGAAVAVRVRLPRSTWPEGPSDALLAEIERAAPGARVASAPRLGRELRGIATRDVLRMGGLAVLVVGLVVWVSYRGRIRETALTFVPVALGTIWTFGLWGWAGLPFDLFSACVLPVMVGIGVDDGLHVLHLARSAKTRSLGDAAIAAGRGVVLTNLTTCAGFGALFLSSVPSLRTAGAFVCAGNLACLAAALVVLPAIAARVPPYPNRS
jgi:hypothetical protein